VIEGGGDCRGGMRSGEEGIKRGRVVEKIGVETEGGRERMGGIE
jgi:hypothetical protein